MLSSSFLWKARIRIWYTGILIWILVSIILLSILFCEIDFMLKSCRGMICRWIKYKYDLRVVLDVLKLLFFVDCFLVFTCGLQCYFLISGGACEGFCQ